VVGRFGVDGGSDLAITYTPLHGVGGQEMMSLFAAAGYCHVHVVDEQFAPDAEFPTLPFPNPEEPGALDLAIARAEATGSTLVIANDPDADRLGVAVATPTGWRTLRGDEVGWLLASLLLPTMREGDAVATTIVSSTMLAAMAAEVGVTCATTLTGFKWISRAAGARRLAFGYEEALGYAVDPMVADKDGLSAALALCFLAHGLAREGSTLLARLDELESRFGVHCVGQVALRAEGADGRARIARALDGLRQNPPDQLGGVAVSEVVDLATGWRGLAPTEGVYVGLGPSGRVVVRPSGTEAKLKAYVEITRPPGTGPLDEVRALAGAALESVRRDLEERLAL
jgi:phosphomannomutase